MQVCAFIVRLKQELINELLWSDEEANVTTFSDEVKSSTYVKPLTLWTAIYCRGNWETMVYMIENLRGLLIILFERSQSSSVLWKGVIKSLYHHIRCSLGFVIGAVVVYPFYK